MYTPPLWIANLPTKARVTLLTKAHALILHYAQQTNIATAKHLQDCAGEVWALKCYIEQEAKRRDSN